MILIAAMLLNLTAFGMSTSAKSSYLMLANNGEMLFAENENERLPMASTTKIATAIVALENMDINETYTIKAEEVGIEGSSMNLREGEVYTLDELLYGLMLVSGNDAALAIANMVGGSHEDFVAMMNRLCEKLGLVDTAFMNTSGLDAEGHYTTAKELAVLTAYALSNEDFCRYVSTQGITIAGDETRVVKNLINKNRMLYDYEGAIGVKTGYTVASGRSLVTAAEREGILLVAVTIRDSNDWHDHANMLDYGFEITRSVDLKNYLPQAIRIPVAGGGEITVIMDEVAAMPISADMQLKLEARIILPPFVYSGIGLMEQVGELRFYQDEQCILTVPLRSAVSVPERIETEQNFIEKLLDKIEDILD